MAPPKNGVSKMESIEIRPYSGRVSREASLQKVASLNSLDAFLGAPASIGTYLLGFSQSVKVEAATSAEEYGWLVDTMPLQGDH